MKIITNWSELGKKCRELKQKKLKIVFTNGVFDIIHHGHVDYLQKARARGDALIVGLNSDASVKRLKGEHRPINSERDRAFVMAAMACIDYVTIFDQDTPLELIEALTPDILVKGGDWPIENIVGREVVEAHGGIVLSIPYLEGFSTTTIIEKIIQVYT